MLAYGPGGGYAPLREWLGAPAAWDWLWLVVLPLLAIALVGACVPPGMLWHPMHISALPLPASTSPVRPWAWAAMATAEKVAAATRERTVMGNSWFILQAQ